MNIKTKQCALFASVALLSPFISSCDSDSDSDSNGTNGSGTTIGSSAENRNSTFVIDSAIVSSPIPYLLALDEFAYEIISGPDIFRFDSPGAPYLFTTNSEGVVEAIPAITRSLPLRNTYNVTGTQTFILTANFSDGETGFSTAMANLFGAPTTVQSRTIGVPFRQRLLVPGDSVSFSRPELQSMVDEINLVNGNVILHPTEDVILDLDQASSRINHVITSNNAELIRGQMDGVYTVDIMNARAVEFRRPTEIEISQINTGIRLITSSHWLPVATGANYTVTGFQDGNFVLDLDNIAITPIQ